MDKKSYLASELSGLIGVPRTTINDWLTKYSVYIDCDSRGKRRVYGEAAVAVLREIASLRASGRSAFEIESALEGKYGVRPEIAKPESAPQDVPDPASPKGGERAPVSSGTELARNSDNSAALAAFERQMQEWKAQIEEAQQARRKTTRRGFFVLALLMLLLFGLGGGAAYYLGLLAIKRLENEKSTLDSKLAAMEGRRAESEAARSREVGALRELLKISDSQRREQLEEQKKAFAAELKKLAADGRTRSEAEQRKLRDEFAASQQKLLRELEKLRAESAPPPAVPEKSVSAPLPEVKVPAPSPAPAKVAPEPAAPAKAPENEVKK